MNKTNDATTNAGNAKAGDRTRPASSAPPATDTPDPRGAAPEVVHQVTPRDEIKKPQPPAPAKESDGSSPRPAAAGNGRAQVHQAPRS